MKKLILVLLILSFLAASAGIVMAQPGPWKSKSGKVEEIAYYNGETLLRKWTGDDGFQLWITGNREMHCVYKLMGQNDGNGWSGPSSWMKKDLEHGGDGKDYMYKCDSLEIDPAEQACINSGGTAGTSMCCLTTSDFPDTCSIGACGCSPENSHEVKVCNCPEGKCFNGSECVAAD